MTSRSTCFRAERPSSRRAAWLLVRPSTQPEPEEQALLTALRQQGSQFETAAVLSQQFVQMVQQRQADWLDDWIARAGMPEVAVELHRFANGLKEDLSAVRAALSLPWSNGQVEGQVNRLKWACQGRKRARCKGSAPRRRAARRCEGMPR